MLASLLPGLRDLRTPLATGYLWVVALWLLLHDQIPVTVQEAQGPIKALYQLGALVGNTAMLAALTFIAYLLGSMLRMRPSPNFVRIVHAFRFEYYFESEERSGPRFVLDFLSDKIRGALSISVSTMYSQLLTFVQTRLRETASDLDIDDHIDIVEGSRRSARQLDLRRVSEQGEGSERTTLDLVYVQLIGDDFPAIGTQLQAKNRDLWDTYDRQLAEAQFRYGIAPPMAVIIYLVARQSNEWWWLLLLAAPTFLFLLGYRHFVEAASTLVQAVVLKMVVPPIMEKLNEEVEKRKSPLEAARIESKADLADAESPQRS